MGRGINYSVIRFRPYRKTGEFVNIGVVSIDLETGVILYEISESSVGKIVRVFPYCDKRLADNVIGVISEELNRLSIMSKNTNLDKMMKAFNNTISIKEGLFFFSDRVAAIIDCDLVVHTKRLCEEYVDPK